MKISKRQRKVLSPMILYGWELDEHRDSYHIWQGDILSTFRAFEALDHCIQDGLVVRMPNSFGRRSSYRITGRGKTFACQSRSCHRGQIYDEDTVIGECPICEGTGVILSNAKGDTLTTTPEPNNGPG